MAIEIAVATLGASFMNPSDNSRPIAQPVSKIAATMRYTHGETI